MSADENVNARMVRGTVRLLLVVIACGIALIVGMTVAALIGLWRALYG